jgi:DNA modification methylase
MEIIFKSDTKHRKRFLTANHFAHPAKMPLPLQRWLIERYTKPGDVILDPMGGSGTLLVACTMGRHVILVELEQKFVRMQEDNWAKIQTFGAELGYEMGTATILRGDARNLEGILCDAIITSPPYEATLKRDKSKEPWWDEKRERKFSGGSVAISKGYQPDCIITSPPYAEMGIGDWQTGRAEFQEWVLNELATKGYVEWQGQRYTESEWRAMNHGRIDGRTTGETWHRARGFSSYGQLGYAPSSGNIGNLKGESYLSAMLQVYSECFKVLKNGGLLVLVTKNFIRNKKIVPLDEDTIKLCEQARFTLIERHYRRLTAQSFWRIIYQQKYPDAPVIDREDILVFRKLWS